MSCTLTADEIARMVADANDMRINSADMLRDHVRALAAECERLRASRPEWVRCRQEQIEAARDAESLRAQLEAVTAEVKILTALNEHATSERERLAADVARFCENGRALEAERDTWQMTHDEAVDVLNSRLEAVTREREEIRIKSRKNQRARRALMVP